MYLFYFNSLTCWSLSSFSLLYRTCAVDKILMAGGLKLVKPVSGFPHVICYDAAGVVEQADKGGKFQNGDEVFVRLFGPRGENAEQETPYYRGACAEYCVAQAQYCCKKPSNISFEEAAAVPLAGTAHFTFTYIPFCFFPFLCVFCT